MTCSIEGCERPHVARGWCDNHYRRWKRNGDPLAVIRPWSYNGARCSIEGCSAPATRRGWCSVHYERWRQHGDALHPVRDPMPINVGNRFGRLTVVSDAPRRRNGQHWLCDCDCGGQAVVLASNLRYGKTESCGCRSSRTHGLSHTAAYGTWMSMLGRCEDPDHAGFESYGGRGITVCRDWHLFEYWWIDVRELAGRPYDDDGHRVVKRVSMDRIGNDGNYEPGNIRWATAVEQRANQRPARRASDSLRSQEALG